MASSSNFDLKRSLDISFEDTTTLDPLCKSIATEIASGCMQLCSFVEILGSYMTDKNVVIRVQGVTALSSVLSQLPEDYLSESELHFITMFYCDRIKDHYKVLSPVLNGILAIVNMKNLPSDAPLSLLRAMFEHVQCQSQLLPERRNIYLIFKSLIENKLDYLRPMGVDLVYGIIGAIDGERDPNNLMVLFSLLPYFIKEFSLGHLAEEMFQVLECYFPVDFNPSRVEDMNVKREDLAKKLAPCLYATSEFMSFCIPLAIDKLNSTLTVAKLDSLNLLCDSAVTFATPELQQHLPSLWTVLRKEIMPGRNAEIKNAALETLTSIIRANSSHEAAFKHFIDKMIADIKPSLCDVQLSLYRPAEKLLEAIASVDKAICMQVVQAIIPLCIGQYSTNISWSNKIALIETLNSFMKICSNYEFCIQDVPELTWTNISQMYLDGLTIENIELKSKMFLGLSIQKAYLNDAQRSSLYNAICNEIEIGCDEIQIICHITTLDFATVYPQEILLLVKEKLLLDEVGIELLKRRIKALLAISRLRELGCVILPKIVAMLTNNVDTDIYMTALLNIQKLIASKKFNFDVHQFIYQECHIIDRLIAYETVVVEHKTLISNVCQIIMRNLTADEQRAIVTKYVGTLNTKAAKTDVAVIMNLLIPLRKDVNVNISNDTIENLHDLAINDPSPYVRQTTCTFLSVLLNKMEIADLDWIVPYIEDRINNLKTDIDVELKQNIVDLQIRITKALVLKGYGRSQDLLEKFTHLLADSQIGRYVGQQYQTLVSNCEDDLTMENFCVIKIFYKQRIFGYLLQQNNNFASSTRQNYLIALVHLLEQMPEEVLFLHLDKLVPLLTESLSLNDEYLILWSLRSLKLLLDTENDVFFDNMECIIPKLLQLSSNRVMDVRIAALKCLTRYACYPTLLIYPYKLLVLNKLGITIDDRKRLVRKAAVEARTRWFMVGAPGGSKK